MAWVKNDDRMDDTKKVKRAWRRQRATIGLWDMAKTYSARHESDGLVPLEWVEEKLPDESERDAVLAVLLDERLFEHLAPGETKRVSVTRVRKGSPGKVTVTHGPLAEDAYLVHDYLEYNEARQEAEERRRADAERKTKNRRKSPDGVATEASGSPDGRDADDGWTPLGVPPVSASSTRPDPTRPDPTPIDPPGPPPSGGRRRDHVRYEQNLAAWAASRFPGCSERAVVGYAKSALAKGASTWDAVAAEVERLHGPAKAAA